MFERVYHYNHGNPGGQKSILKKTNCSEIYIQSNTKIERLYVFKQSTRQIKSEIYNREILFVYTFYKVNRSLSCNDYSVISEKNLLFAFLNANKNGRKCRNDVKLISQIVRYYFVKYQGE